MSYKFLLFDLDDTIFNFSAAEYTALAAMFTEIGIELTPELRHQYHLFNQRLWQMYEKDQITRAELLKTRFILFFKKMKLDNRGMNIDHLYRDCLAAQHQLLPDAELLLQTLHKTYRLFAVTNGIAQTQNRRLTESGIDRYFDDIFISEAIGHQKPQKPFFDYTFAHIPNFESTQALLIGDSLSADILGGQNAKVDTVWFNPDFQPNRTKILPIYQISRLLDLNQLLIEQD
ncbi:YjjG family noncanonical pyrimidine nucleotidase [Agrilactobacillus yilanensis]|uniref:YjjG family noncanonical pyrimidine nucleotidase n=1 Tax=Agrilactobacillus yilanensis TaxID=2485997 RepID=A0ABW4J939_9LACO|nr:YjjG family noncanonical pyrimidine nucleotidase [Agrilactobacillus yilanensis]